MNAFCILFTDTYEYQNHGMKTLSANRTLASVPFGGRYRLIDFMLSSLVSSSVSDIGIITKSMYGSLMDHVGGGKNWDLDRKNGGMKILTPFASETIFYSDNQFEIMRSVYGYIADKLQEYCIIADGNLVCNLDFRDMVSHHLQTGADLTVLTKNKCPRAGEVELSVDEQFTVQRARLHATASKTLCKTVLNVFVLHKSLLMNLVEWGVGYGWKNFGKDVLTKKYGQMRVCAYDVPGYCAVIDSTSAYMQANMDILTPTVRNEIFQKDRPILTRIKDSVPTGYGEFAKISNSLIADGCRIDGKVENSLIFRNVTVEKGACVKNSVIMQNTIVEQGANLGHVILDKNVRIGADKTLYGCAALPFLVNKGKMI